MSVVHDDVTKELLLFGVPIATITPVLGTEYQQYTAARGKSWFCYANFPRPSSLAGEGWFETVDQAIVSIMSQLAWFMWSIGANHTAAGFGEGEPVILVTGGYRRGRERPRVEWAVNAGTVRAHDASVSTNTFVCVERCQRLVLRSPIDFTGLEYRLWEGAQHYGDAPREEAAADTTEVRASAELAEDAGDQSGHLPRD